MKILFVFSLSLLATVGFLAVGESAFAIGRYDLPRSSCSSIQNALSREGEAILYKNGYEYFRAVREAGYCQVGEYLQPAYVNTRDRKDCMVLTCKGR